MLVAGRLICSQQPGNMYLPLVNLVQSCLLKFLPCTDIRRAGKCRMFAAGFYFKLHIRNMQINCRVTVTLMLLFASSSIDIVNSDFSRLLLRWRGNTDLPLNQIKIFLYDYLWIYGPFYNNRSHVSCYIASVNKVLWNCFSENTPFRGLDDHYPFISLHYAATHKGGRVGAQGVEPGLGL